MLSYADHDRGRPLGQVDENPGQGGRGGRLLAERALPGLGRGPPRRPLVGGPTGEGGDQFVTASAVTHGAPR